MKNMFIHWEAFRGYFFTIWDKKITRRYHLNGGEFFLYYPDGTTHRVNLEHGCSLSFNPIDVDFHERRKKDGKIPESCFQRNEIFAVRLPHGRFGEKNAVSLFIPANALNLVVGENYEVEDEYSIMTYHKLTFDIEKFNTFGDQPHPNMLIYNENGECRISVSEFVASRKTNEFSKRIKLSQDIKKTCGVHISEYDLKRLLEHYKLTKKRNVKQEKQ